MSKEEKEEIKKKAEKIADALGYNVNSLSLDVVNVKDSFCMGFVDGHNNAIQSCIDVVREMLDAADLVDDRMSLNTLNELEEKLQSLKK